MVKLTSFFTFILYVFVADAFLVFFRHCFCCISLSTAADAVVVLLSLPPPPPALFHPPLFSSLPANRWSVPASWTCCNYHVSLAGNACCCGDNGMTSFRTSECSSSGRADAFPGRLSSPSPNLANISPRPAVIHLLSGRRQSGTGVVARWVK